MKLRWWVWGLCALLIIGCSALIGLRRFHPPAGPRIEGQVGQVTRPGLFSLSGLGGARVSVTPGGYTTKTRRNGSFTLPVPPGLYRMTISAPGRLPFVQRVQVVPAIPAAVWPVLFTQPAGAPVASLMRSESTPGSGPIAYNTGVYLDASRSKNVDPRGIRWEVTDAAGRIIQDPYAVPTTPLQLKPSPIPGTSPMVFTFVPPAPGRYRVRLFLKNSFSTRDQEASAEWLVEAENRSPEPLPGLAGGLRTAVVGEKVRLAAWALDKNYPSPELYHPAGRQPDAYGRNFLPPFSRFTWQWRLYRLKEAGGRADVTQLLRADGPGNATTSPYPWFVPAEPGRYLAALWAEDHDPSGSLLGNPQTLELTVLPKGEALVSEKNCTRRGCHPQLRVVQTSGAVRVSGGKMSCQACHGPGQLHVAAGNREGRRATLEISYAAAQCGNCHREYGEWQKSRHSDGYAFGYQEIAKPLLLTCAKCHYPQGFASATAKARQERTDFGKVEFKKALFPGGPRVMFDFAQLPEPIGQGVSCQACHDPHRIGSSDRLGLRASRSELCGTCHGDKWQNVLLTQTAGRRGSAYEYPGRKYPVQNPHNTAEKCLLCHMNPSAPKQDASGVRRLGGHTMRMRDAGPDGRLGGFGPSPDDPGRRREEYGRDDLLNLGPCQRCHRGGLTTFDLRGRQSEVYRLWLELGRRLSALNHGRLPGYKPGDKCATCHRGGTLPFDDDPELVLENAYTNYKLVGNDRSWGIHNYRYTRQLLEDSLRSLAGLKIPPDNREGSQ